MSLPGFSNKYIRTNSAEWAHQKSLVINAGWNEYVLVVSQSVCMLLWQQNQTCLRSKLLFQYCLCSGLIFVLFWIQVTLLPTRRQIQTGGQNVGPELVLISSEIAIVVQGFAFSTAGTEPG